MAFIEAHKDHPAIAAGLRYCEEFIQPTDQAVFLRREFARLRERGATAETLLASVMAIFFRLEGLGHRDRLVFGDRCVALNVGRAFIGTVPAQVQISGTGKVRYIRASPGHAESLGWNLIQALGLLCGQCVRKIYRDAGWYAPDERGRQIKKLIEAAPLDPPSTQEISDDEE